MRLQRGYWALKFLEKKCFQRFNTFLQSNQFFFISIQFITSTAFVKSISGVVMKQGYLSRYKITNLPVLNIFDDWIVKIKLPIDFMWQVTQKLTREESRLNFGIVFIQLLGDLQHYFSWIIRFQGVINALNIDQS